MSDDTSRFKVWKLPHPLLIHWVLNPGLCVNEILLGQRIPRVTLIDQSSSRPFVERTYVDCPHCGARHNGKLWAGKAAFRHYNGIYCINCEGKIPALLNLFSILILALTFPIWKPVQIKYGEYFKANSLKRLREQAQTVEEPTPVSGIKMGFQFGLFMGLFFIAMTVFLLGWSVSSVLIGVTSGILSGVLFGAIMSVIMSAKGRV